LGVLEKEGYEQFFLVNLKATWFIFIVCPITLLTMNPLNPFIFCGYIDLDQQILSKVKVIYS